MSVLTRGALAALMVVALSPLVASAQEPKLAYVDMQLAMDRSKSGQEAIDLLNERGKGYKESEEKMRKEIEKLGEELRAKAAVMNPAEKSRREDEIQDKKREFENLVSDNRKRFTREQERFTEKIRQDLLEVIRKFGEEQGYTMILEKNFSAVLYAPKKLDLTDEITKEYDKNYKPRSFE